MFSSFPPFPSPNPAVMNHSPLENAPIVPSPPSSESSSVASSPSSSSSSPSTPASPQLGNTNTKPTRSRSRSAARNSVPPRTRIIRHREGNNQSSKSATPPRTPPVTPPSETQTPAYHEEVVKIPDTSDSGILRKKSVRNHNYEDAVRIACGAWGEAGHKKKTVSWGDNVQA